MNSKSATSKPAADELYLRVGNSRLCRQAMDLYTEDNHTLSQICEAEKGCLSVSHVPDTSMCSLKNKRFGDDPQPKEGVHSSNVQCGEEIRELRGGSKRGKGESSTFYLCASSFFFLNFPRYIFSLLTTFE